MVEKDGKKLYWCDQHQYPGNATEGMYVFHTNHDSWAAKKVYYKKKKGGNREFPDGILNSKISFVEGENRICTRECPIKLFLATSPCASFEP
jgi:hypothetical protein